MDHRVKAQDLRQLLSLAGRLRESAAATVDLRYTDLFLRAATALDDHASQLAASRADISIDRERRAILHAPVSLMC